jgi:hypothetical protein
VDSLSNQFGALNVIDGTETKTKSSKNWVISSDKLKAVMKHKFDDDD